MKASQALEIFLSMNTTAFKAGAKAAGNTVTNMGGTIKRSLKVSRTAFTVGQKSVMAYKNRLKELNTTAGGLNSTFAGLRRTVGLLFAGAGVVSLVRLADTYTLLNSRIGLVTRSLEEQETVQKRLFQIAQESRQSYIGTAEVYNRFAQAVKGLGVSNDELLTITESLNKAFVISGATSAETKNTLIQLSQAFSSGVLRGDEFRSMMEQGSRAVDMLTDYLGVNRGELREMAEDGQITSDVMREAFVNGLATVSEEFNQLPITVGQSMTLLRNEWGRIVDEFNQAEGVTGGIAEAIKLLADNLDQVLEPALIAMTALVTVIRENSRELGRLIGAMVTAAAKTMEWVVSHQALIVILGKTLLLVGALVKIGQAISGVTIVVQALSSAFVVLTGNSIAAWAGKGVEGFANLRKGLSMTRISAMGLKGVLGSFAGIFLAWEAGLKIGEFLNKFGIVKKVALGLIYTFDRGRLKIKQFWAMLTGGDAAGVELELAAAKDAYHSLIAEIDAGKDKGVSAHEKIAQAAADSAQSQVDSQVGALNKMGEAYGEYADKIKKLMPGEEGYEGSKAYQSWKAIEGGGNTLDAPEEGMSKEELAEFYRSKKEREEKNTPQIAKEEQKAADVKVKGAKQDLALAREKRKEETAAASGRRKEKEKELYLEEQAIKLRQKEEQDRSRDGSVRDDQESRKTGSSGAVDPMFTLNKQMEEGAAVQDPIITTPDPVIVNAPTVDATPALANVFDEYVNRTQEALAKSPWSVRGSNDDEATKAPEFSQAIPELTSLAAPLENMKQQARDAVAAVPASLAAMTSSSVHNLINKLQTGGSRSASSGSRAGVAVNVPKKIIELRFPGGSLQGGEHDVNALLSHLEKAGLTA